MAKIQKFKLLIPFKTTQPVFDYTFNLHRQWARRPRHRHPLQNVSEFEYGIDSCCHIDTVKKPAMKSATAAKNSIKFGFIEEFENSNPVSAPRKKIVKKVRFEEPRPRSQKTDLSHWIQGSRTRATQTDPTDEELLFEKKVKYKAMAMNMNQKIPRLVDYVQI